MRFFLGRRDHLDATRQLFEARSYSRLELQPCNATIGAAVQGVQLANVDDETFREIEQAFLDYKVLFFRDQALETSEHVAFARRFGELEEHPFLPPSHSDEALVRFEKSDEVVGVENQWHTDVSWRERPALGSMLRAIEVPRYGGDTLFADMVAEIMSAISCHSKRTSPSYTGTMKKRAPPMIRPRSLSTKGNQLSFEIH